MFSETFVQVVFVVLLTIFLAATDVLGDANQGTDAAAGAVDAVLNGLHLTVDSQTGSILKMSYPGPDVMLDADRKQASIIDMAYPSSKCDYLRLASRFSNGAKIIRTDVSLTISWEKLGLSPKADTAGNVAAKVVFKASPDGNSVIMTCEVENKSDIPVRQVIFPDLYGLQPVGGIDGTIFTTCSFSSAPFRELQMDEGRRSTQFCMDSAYGAVEYAPGGCLNRMVGRWMDLSGLNGGFSLFPKRWGWEPQVNVRLHLSETDHTLRLLCVHPTDIKSGEKWESGEFILTPHKSGWAKGIEAYRQWVRQNLKREYPVPEHVRKALGFRSLWMNTGSGDLSWTFKDLTKVAKESKEYGLDEIVLWGWESGFHLPLPQPFPGIGTEQEFAGAVAECRKMGVNVVPFISVVQVTKDTAAKYGTYVPETGGWTQGLSYIPRFQPPYANSYVSNGVDVTNKVWQQEVLDSCKHLIDIGISSLCWDQFWGTNAPEPNMYSLTSRIRQMAKKVDSESTFSGEELWNIELDSNHLDYTWNWGGYGDCQGLTNVFPLRKNCCVSSDPVTVKRGFLDNLYLTVFPRKAGGVNGSDYISNWPELGAALKQCAKLRSQFIPYFMDGTLIGNCILSKPCPGTHISAYVLPDMVLMLLLNIGGPQKLSFDVDLSTWLQSRSGAYRVKCYNADGKAMSAANIDHSLWHSTTPVMGGNEIAIYEFFPNN